MNLRQLIQETASPQQKKEGYRSLNKEQLAALNLSMLPNYQSGKHWDSQKDRYRSPGGYSSWNRHLGFCLFHASADSGFMAETSGDRAGLAVYSLCGYALDNNAPARYISKELCNSFLRTPYPAVSNEMLDVFPAVHVLLPKGSLISDEGVDITALVIRAGELFPTLSDKEREKAMEAARRCGQTIIPKKLEGARGVAVAAISDLYAYSWIKFVKAELNTFEYDVSHETAEVASLTEAIGRIAVNSLLVHLYEPELITTDKSVAFRSGSGFGASAPRTLPPTWIGKSFRSTSERHRSRPSESTRGPVQPHWRRGHWHTVLHGPGRQERRMQWFRPVYVNGSS